MAKLKDAGKDILHLIQGGHLIKSFTTNHKLKHRLCAELSGGLEDFINYDENLSENRLAPQIFIDDKKILEYTFNRERFNLIGHGQFGEVYDFYEDRDIAEQNKIWQRELESKIQNLETYKNLDSDARRKQEREIDTGGL